MWRWRRKPLQVQYTFDEALDAVLAYGVAGAAAGAYRFKKAKQGCTVQLLQGYSQPPSLVAVVCLRTIDTYLQRQDGKFSAGVVIHAVLEEPRTIASGIQRRTHPGYSNQVFPFDSVRKLELWLRTPLGREVGNSNLTTWYAYVRVK